MSKHVFGKHMQNR